MTLDVDRLMRGLSERRPIFHSEADFQLALARHILKTMDCRFRLEHPFSYGGRKKSHLDIWLPTERVAIELKHFTAMLELDCDGEPFALKDQAATDEMRCGFLKDVQRLEYMVRDKEKQVRVGFAVLLTNARSLWERSRRLDARRTNDANFLLYEGRKIKGELLWQKDKGVPNEAREPVYLNDSYTMRWKDYSNFPGKNYGNFRYLAVSVQ